MKPDTIRPFVSSTFVDMQLERDVLATRVFPKLRLCCELRGGTWREIDLRWGVPSDRATEETVEVCLDEIGKCQPLFIAILGERYGAVECKIADSTLAKYEWIGDCKGSSVTGLEIFQQACAF
jgi:hypothetical protein